MENIFTNTYVSVTCRFETCKDFRLLSITDIFTIFVYENNYFLTDIRGKNAFFCDTCMLCI